MPVADAWKAAPTAGRYIASRLRTRSSRRHLLKEYGFITVPAPQAKERLVDAQARRAQLGRLLLTGGLSHRELVEAQVLQLPLPRRLIAELVTRPSRWDRARPYLRRLRPLAFLKTVVARDPGPTYEIYADIGQGLSLSLAELAVAESRARTVVFGSWDQLRSSIDAHGLIDAGTLKSPRWRPRRAISLAPVRKPLVVVDDCPARPLAEPPHPTFDRFLTVLVDSRLPFVLGVKRIRPDSNPRDEYVGYLRGSYQHPLTLRRREVGPLAHQWLTLAAESYEAIAPQLDFDRVERWADSHRDAYRRDLASLVWLLWRRVDIDRADPAVAAAVDELMHMNATRRDSVLVAALMQALDIDSYRGLVEQIYGNSGRAALAWLDRLWRHAPGDPSRPAGTSWIRTVAAEVLDAGLRRARRLDDLLRDLIDRTGARIGDGDEDVLRLLFHRLAKDWNPLLKDLGAAAIVRHIDVAAAPWFRPSPLADAATQLAWAATYQALGAESQAQALYGELLGLPTPIHEDRPAWYSASLLIGVKRSRPGLVATEKYARLALDYVSAATSETLPPKMALGLADALLEVAKQNDGLERGERYALLARSEELVRSTFWSPTVRLQAHNLLARLVGGVAGEYIYNGAQRPSLEVALAEAVQAFESQAPERDDPAMKTWQDVITHNVLGFVYKLEYERTGAHLEDAYRHLRRSLEGLPRRDLDIGWRQQLSHCIRGFTGFGWFCARHGYGEAESWFEAATKLVRTTPHNELPPDAALAYLRRDRFLEKRGASEEQRLTLLSEGLALLEPSDARQALVRRFERLVRPPE
jgi:tetratricopeptide (TPR) repeat protein